jgi:hypothetical protein
MSDTRTIPATVVKGERFAWYYGDRGWIVREGDRTLAVGVSEQTARELVAVPKMREALQAARQYFIDKGLWPHGPAARQVADALTLVEKTESLGNTPTNGV